MSLSLDQECPQMSPGRDTWNWIYLEKHGYLEFQCLGASSCPSRGQDPAHGVLPKCPGHPKSLGWQQELLRSSPVLAVLEISPLEQAAPVDEVGFRHCCPCVWILGNLLVHSKPSSLLKSRVLLIRKCSLGETHLLTGHNSKGK